MTSHLIRQLIQIFLLPCAFAGCSFMPVDQTEHMPDLQKQFTQSGKHTASNYWWQEFNDPQLNRLVEDALSNNFSLKSYLARLEEAAAQADIQGSSLYPSLSGSVKPGYRRNMQENGNIYQNDNIVFGLNSHWEIDLWGRLSNRKEAAVNEYLASSEVLQSAAISLAGNIARTWYQLSEQNARLEILTAQLTNIRKVTEISRLRYLSGQDSISTVWRQEQLEEEIRADYQQTLRRKNILAFQLNVLLGKSPSAEPSWQYSSFPELPILPSTGIPAELIENRPDIRDRWYQYQARRHKVAEAISARLPSFTLTAGANLSTNDLDELFDLWATDFAISMNIPIFNGGQLASQQKQAETRATRAFYDYTQTVLTALREVETSLLEEQSKQEQLNSLQEQTGLASNILDIESARYRQGIQQYLDVLNAQERLFDLQLRSVNIERQVLDRRITLYQSLGGRIITIGSNGELLSTVPSETIGQ
ncbi:efflux transporter outer membrane subunit [Endozoicomonas atrinae]|uniref:efflux transporter outer membrane subunit n=1 Tax=Endozoicomonas atrinae TaxID=1333660 RepID=UPI003AFFAAA6